MKKIVIILGFLLMGVHVYGQDDSPLQLLNRQVEDSLRITDRGYAYETGLNLYTDTMGRIAEIQTVSGRPPLGIEYQVFRFFKSRSIRLKPKKVYGFLISFKNGSVASVQSAEGYSAYVHFNGGDANEFSRWIYSQLVYPEAAKRVGIQGKVMVSFTITESGKVDNVKVVKGVHPLLDAEAVRVISRSPKWTPAQKLGSPIAITYTFPVIFQVRNGY